MTQSRLLSAIVSPKHTIKQAIQILNENTLQILLVVDEHRKLLGTISDGDIRRGIVADEKLTDTVDRIMHPKPATVAPGEEEKAKSLIYKNDFRAVPVVDAQGIVVDLIHWKDFGTDLDSPSRPRECPVFILAGGKGTRMRPFTNILPKPLIPIGETPILEIIMHRFQKNGFNKFIISLNYRAEFVKLYFAESVEEYDLEFVQEEKFLGTGGSLHLIKNRFADTVIVSNCDVLLDIDFGDFLDYHKQQGNAATIVGVLRHVKIPYGVMEMRDGALVSFREKPEFDFIINAGIYAVEPEILSHIQDNVYSDMPDILEQAKDRGAKIGIYPVSSDMVDIGHWDEYNKAVDFLKREKVISEDADNHRLNRR